jgi:ABC-2 type transport system permease protein
LIVGASGGVGTYAMQPAKAAGLATAGLGLTFAALTAVAIQVFENARGVYGAALAIGASFTLRAAGDVGNGALSWLSPIGWGSAPSPTATTGGGRS